MPINIIMLISTNITISKKLLENLIIDDLESIKTAINQPTGNFFYDRWTIKPEYKNTVWEKLISVLPNDIGEARIIILESGTNYFQHADIDDRYHLNLTGKDSYLIDLESHTMHGLTQDGIWYLMDAGKIHSAANFGENKRIQLVVRKLLTHHNLKNPYTIQIIVGGTNPRFVFDNSLSPWLNRANKKGIIDNFKTLENGVEFIVEKDEIEDLISHVPKEFQFKLI
jgi:hypothetical protein